MSVIVHIRALVDSELCSTFPLGVTGSILRPGRSERPTHASDVTLKESLQPFKCWFTQPIRLTPLSIVSFLSFGGGFRADFPAHQDGGLPLAQLESAAKASM